MRRRTPDRHIDDKDRKSVTYSDHHQQRVAVGSDDRTAAYPIRRDGLDTTMLLPQVAPPPVQQDTEGVPRAPLIVLGVVTAAVALVVAGFFAGRSANEDSADVPQTSAITTAAVPSGDDLANVTSLAEADPVIATETVIENSPEPFAIRTVTDRTQPKGTRTVRKHGVAGLRRTTFEVTYHDHVPVDRRIVRSVVATKPVTEVVAVGIGKPKPKR